MAEDIHLPDMERGEGMQEGKLSERALKRSVLRPLQQTVQKIIRTKLGLWSTEQTARRLWKRPVV